MHMRAWWAFLAVAAVGGVAALGGVAQEKAKPKPPPVIPYESGVVWQEPAKVTPGTNGGPPSDAIVLFDGKSMDAWTGGDKWEIADGYGIAKSAVSTKQPF